jgi:hypothetical protein
MSQQHSRSGRVSVATRTVAALAAVHAPAAVHAVPLATRLALACGRYAFAGEQTPSHQHQKGRSVEQLKLQQGVSSHLMRACCLLACHTHC